MYYSENNSSYEDNEFCEEFCEEDTGDVRNIRAVENVEENLKEHKDENLNDNIDVRNLEKVGNLENSKNKEKCSHVHTEIINGFFICNDCGTELSSDISDEAEWRYYNSSNNIEPTR